MKSLAPSVSSPCFYSHCSWSGFADVLGLCMSVCMSVCVDHFQFIFQRGVVRHRNWTRPKQWNNPRLTDWLEALGAKTRLAWSQRSLQTPAPATPLSPAHSPHPPSTALLLLISTFPFYSLSIPSSTALVALHSVCVFNVVKQLEQTENLG